MAGRDDCLCRGRGGHRRADQHLVCGRRPGRADHRWLGLGFWPQSTVFIVLSGITLALVRPLAKKLLRPGYSATNADRVIGTVGVVTQAVNNLAGEGLVNLAGQVWSARSKTEEVIPAGQEVRVLHIQGVKVIVEPVTADQTKAV